MASRSVLRLALCAAVAIGALAGTVGCTARASTLGSTAGSTSAQPTFTTLAPVDKPRVAVVGDSLTYTATPELLWQLRNAGWEVVTVDGTLGAPIADRVRIVRELATGEQLDAIVLALGSNDARLNGDTGRDVGAAWRDTQSAAFTALAEAQTVPCVIWVGVNTNTDRWSLSKWGAWFNAWLRYYAFHADWSATSLGHPEWFLADDVHLTPGGNAAYAGLMVDSLAEHCLPAGA